MKSFQYFFDEYKLYQGLISHDKNWPKNQDLRNIIDITPVTHKRNFRK